MPLDDDIDLLWDYFRDLSPVQREQFRLLGKSYREWNERINVISRKDIGHLYLHHVIHSLAIARFVQFRSGSIIMDVGTGGGFPGIPLAIMFPESRFVLVDSIGKKLKVAEAVASMAGILNIETRHIRAEQIKESFDFVVSRAVTSFPEFAGWVSHNISKNHKHPVRNGIIYLKGGDLSEELRPFGQRVSVVPVSDFFPDQWFAEKKIIYLPF